MLFIAYCIFIFSYLITLRRIWFVYHGYVGKVIGCEIFQHYSGSFDSSLSHFILFFRGALGVPLVVRLVVPTFLRCWFWLLLHLSFVSNRMITLFLWCNDTCRNWRFFLLSSIVSYSGFITPSYLFSCLFENLEV
jgi:hypothetical protein